MIVYTWLHVCVESFGNFALDGHKSQHRNGRKYFAVRLHLKDVHVDGLKAFLKRVSVTLDDIDRFEQSQSLREIRPLRIRPNSRIRHTDTVCITLGARELSSFASVLENE